MKRKRLVVHTTDGKEHQFYDGSDTYVAHVGATLQVVDRGSLPAQATNFSMTNVIRWGIEEVEVS